MPNRGPIQLYSRRHVRIFGLTLFFSAITLAGASLTAAEARWWKGNLHTHTLWSDGDDYPEMVAEWYKNNGYHFLALSDHNILADRERWTTVAANKGGETAFQKYWARFGGLWVEQRDGEKGREVRLKMLSEFAPRLEEQSKFLLIPSEEITSKGIHINATNIQELILPYTGADQTKSEGVVATIQRVVNLVFEQRERTGVPMFPHLNHPNFGWAVSAEELMQVDRERFFEVYNGHPSVHNEGDELHAGTERVWDIILTKRLAELGKEVVYGIGTDDAHHYHTNAPKASRPGQGWVMVQSEKLDPESLVRAMEAGRFYASSGVTLNAVASTSDRLTIEISGEPDVTYKTEFIGTRRGYNPVGQTITDASGNSLRVTRKYGQEIGQVLATVSGTAAAYHFKGDEIYVRARVTSSKAKKGTLLEGEMERAWVQPAVVRPKN